MGPECTSSFSKKTDSNKNETGVQETQFLAAALQKPLASKRATPPPLLSVYPTASSVTPVSTPSSLPSIDLGLAISNFTSNASSSGSGNPSEVGLKKRKLATDHPDGCLKTETTDERKPEPHLAMVDMTPPNSIANDDLNEPNQPRQDPLQDRVPPPRTDLTPRPYQSQCRGNWKLKSVVYKSPWRLTFHFGIRRTSEERACPILSSLWWGLPQHFRIAVPCENDSLWTFRLPVGSPCHFLLFYTDLI